MHKVDYREIARGYEHNDLDALADRLDGDGHHALAADYRERARLAQAAYSHLVELGRISERRDCMLPERGAHVVDLLLDNGWTAPEWLPTPNREETPC